MSKLFFSSLEALFAGSKGPGTALDFEWRLVRRHGRPFLLVPTKGANARVSLTLYSAQRRLAKAYRALFPLLFHSPAARLFKRVRLSANSASDLIQFLAEQAGVPAEQLPAPAIKFGGLDEEKRRLVLLLCDGTGRPFKVVKAGLDAKGREATRREADFLEQLPANTLGCIRLAGRLDTLEVTAFATNYFPAESPANDAGFELLFHAWLNPSPPVPVASLETWRELEAMPHHREAVGVLRAAMAGTQVRSTLYHGDFAPWNIRAFNSANVQAFDWEAGCREGIPGWDWFHFITQTAMLAQRLPVERAAAEVEQLLASPRFEQYAAAAGIRDIARPLLLGHLLHQRWIVRPLEGRRATWELYALLAERWNLHAEVAEPMPETPWRPGAVQQCQTAVARLANAFWEPRLNHREQPALTAAFAAHWRPFLVCSLLLAGGAMLRCSTDQPMLFLPFYLIPCLILTWFAERRLGMLLAAVAAFLGPAITFLRVPGYDRWDTTLWNALMQFMVYQAGVLFVDKMHRGNNGNGRPAPPGRPAANLRDVWAVLLMSGLWLGGVAWLDYVTPPQMSFLPLYLLPCMILTLTFNLRWGILTALVAVACASASEYLTNPFSNFDLAFHWNFCVRFLIAVIILKYLDQLRKADRLFLSGRDRTRRPKPGTLAAGQKLPVV
jgi:hypothetical protein